ncbi:MAG TPA: autotransporter domain-containing protein [Pseudolabrys sp.]|nr:autotransporter domain-containing protein [Pseudolabrys sp.]
MRSFIIRSIARTAVLILVPLAAGTAGAADLPAKAPVYKAPAPIIYNWTGFYVGAGFGYGMFNLDSSLTNNGLPESDNVTNAGRGFFGTVGAGFDYQFTNRILAGVFADWDFSDIKGHFGDPWWERSGAIKQNWAWAAGARIGYLANPAVLSYFSGGFTQARFSGVTLTDFGLGQSGFDTTQAQTYDGWFLGSGIEAMLPGLPGWSVKTEYRFSDFGSKDVTIFSPGGAPSGGVAHVHPYVQTVRAELAYKFGWGRDMLGASAMAYAPPAAPAVHNWTGFYVGAGGGYGMFNVDSSITENGNLRSDNQTVGGRGWFGTVGGGFDYQFAGRFLAGVLADWDISDIHGNWSDPYWEEAGPMKQKWAWSAGGRAGYLITPDLLAYVSGGFTQARFSDVHFFAFGLTSQPEPDTLPAQTYSGWFIGGGAETMVPWFPGFSVRSEYRFADYGTKDVPIINQPSVAVDHQHVYVQTIRTALVYRFNVGR